MLQLIIVCSLFERERVSEQDSQIRFPSTTAEAGRETVQAAASQSRVSHVVPSTQLFAPSGAVSQCSL